MKKWYPVSLPFISHPKTVFSQVFNVSTIASNVKSEIRYLSACKLRYKRTEFANLLQLHIIEDPLQYLYKVHGRIIIWGFQFDTFLGNILMNSYSKSGCIHYARLLFDKMPKKNLVSWSTVVTMYAQEGYGQQALMIFLDFRRSCDENTNEFILASVLRACTRLGVHHLGAQLHNFILKTGFNEDVYVSTSMIDFYTKVGDMDEARMAFNELTVRTTATWTAMMTGYAKSRRSDASLAMFSQMMNAGISPDKYALCCALSACAICQCLECGKQIHTYVLRREIHMDISMMNALIDFYAQCGGVKIGQKLFDQMDVKNIITWTTMMAGYMQNSFYTTAWELFSEMFRLGWKPDDFACSSVLTSCGSLEAPERGKQVHAYTIKENLESDEFVMTGLIDMYSKCNSLVDARKAFDGMSEYNVVSYNAMIEGYSRHDKLLEALGLFLRMRLESFPPNLLTFISLLGVSASVSALNVSKQIHGLMMKFGASLDVFAASSLIDVYSKCSSLNDAKLVFDEVTSKDVVVWNALFFGLIQLLENEEALQLYHRLQLSGQKPNDSTYVAMITVASSLASLRLGQQFHNQLLKAGLESNSFVTNALVGMYAKCGNLDEARKMFNITTFGDVACWNSMISAYAHHGEAKEALSVYERLLKEGIRPNYVSFVGVLSACNHAGLVADGINHFKSMLCYGIEPGTEHYASMVSLFGREGKLQEAKDFILNMPIKPAPIVWRTLLSACQAAANVQMSEYAAAQAISADPADSGPYILLSNTYASKGMWAHVNNSRRKLETSGVTKEPGCSWVEINNMLHVFLAEDRTHFKADIIYTLLGDMIQHIKAVGYVSNTYVFGVDD